MSSRPTKSAYGTDALQSYRAEPPLPPVVRGIASVNGAELAFVDTGGVGECVLLLHAFTGSVDSWGYQLPALAAAGYRAVAFSRRGHAGSSSDAGDFPGRTVADVDALISYLALGRVHLVATAAGGFSALDYAINRPDDVRGLMIASSLAGIDEPAFKTACEALLPPGFHGLPAAFRELGPSYRAYCPEGTERWEELVRRARSPETKLPMKTAPIGWREVEAIRLPCLMMTGSCDLYMPPPLLRELAGHFHDAAVAYIPDAGHATHWEQPDLFNEQLLAFLSDASPSRG